MILIHEVQYDNRGGFQERKRSYESWNKYLENIQMIDGMRDDSYPTLPRQTRAINLIIKDNRVDYEFVHPIFNEVFKGYTEIIKEQNK
jgi:hypothetical protein